MLLVWVVVVLISVVAAEEFCENVDDTVETMSRILGTFYQSLLSVNADVALGLRIASVILEKIPENPKSVEINQLRGDCEYLINGYIDGKFGEHTSSPTLIPYMLNTTLWQRIIKNEPDFLKGEFIPVEIFSLKAELSDECFKKLFTGKCDINPPCFTDNPTQDLTYEKTHYLLYLQIASALDCVDENLLFSSNIIICRDVYHDMITKSLKSLPELDILMEGIVLCGIEGYTSFTTRDFQNFIKKFEKNGCFHLPAEGTPRMKKTDTLMTQDCHSHTNAVGFAANALFLKTLIKNCEMENIV